MRLRCFGDSTKLAERLMTEYNEINHLGVEPLDGGVDLSPAGASLIIRVVENYVHNVLDRDLASKVYDFDKKFMYGYHRLEKCVIHNATALVNDVKAGTKVYDGKDRLINFFQPYGSEQNQDNEMLSVNDADAYARLFKMYMKDNASCKKIFRELETYTLNGTTDNMPCITERIEISDWFPNLDLEITPSMDVLAQLVEQNKETILNMDIVKHLFISGNPHDDEENDYLNIRDENFFFEKPLQFDTITLLDLSTVITTLDIGSFAADNPTIAEVNARIYALNPSLIPNGESHTMTTVGTDSATVSARVDDVYYTGSVTVTFTTGIPKVDIATLITTRQIGPFDHVPTIDEIVSAINAVNTMPAAGQDECDITYRDDTIANIIARVDSDRFTGNTTAVGIIEPVLTLSLDTYDATQFVFEPAPITVTYTVSTTYGSVSDITMSFAAYPGLSGGDYVTFDTSRNTVTIYLPSTATSRTVDIVANQTNASSVRVSFDFQMMQPRDGYYYLKFNGTGYEHETPTDANIAYNNDEQVEALYIEGGFYGFDLNTLPNLEKVQCHNSNSGRRGVIINGAPSLTKLDFPPLMENRCVVAEAPNLIGSISVNVVDALVGFQNTGYSSIAVTGSSITNSSVSFNTNANLSAINMQNLSVYATTGNGQTFNLNNNPRLGLISFPATNTHANGRITIYTDGIVATGGTAYVVNSSEVLFSGTVGNWLTYTGNNY